MMVAPNPPSRSGWKRLKPGEPCPACGHKGFCTISADGAVCRCMRLSSDRPVKTGNKMGWIHSLTPGQAAAVKTFTPEAQPKRSPAEWLKLATRFRINGKARDVDRLAASLGVSRDALDRLRFGWVSARELKDLNTGCKSTGAWTFPMRSPMGAVVGVRLRAPDGFKYAVSGSRAGLFIPTGLVPIRGELHVCEGPTSCAALLTMGFSAIGRPSCSDGVAEVIAFVRAMKLCSVIVWGDKDDAKPLPGGKVFYPGQDGAKAMARELGAVARVFIPPVKDARDWLKGGATTATVEQAIGLRRTA